jgi:hypothetical protein
VRRRTCPHGYPLDNRTPHRTICRAQPSSSNDHADLTALRLGSGKAIGKLFVLS